MVNARSKRRSYLSFVLPAFIIYATIMVFPLVFTLGLSFTKWKGYGPIEFVGLRNYVRLLSDPVFHIGLRNNILIVLISVFGQIPLGFLLAYMLHRRMVKGAKLFEIMIFLPITISSVIVAQLWNRVFAPVGILPTIIRQITGNQDYIMKIFESKDFAFVPIMFVLLWQHTSLYMVIFLANLQRIPESIIEAAKIEGANEGTIFLKIIAPILAPVAFINSILAISGSFKSFDLIYSMTGGGPAHFTEVMAVYMYNTTFVFQNYGYGSAISIVIILFIVLAIWLTKVMTNRLNMG
ncbi:MAG TPA: sugar ABC transporter permease [Rectinema sp.]|nr:sugar ABC transporter permease [Rectinema sp.]HPN03818.1 sugar ABC transporter permease [Rectinema sp.]